MENNNIENKDEVVNGTSELSKLFLKFLEEKDISANEVIEHRENQKIENKQRQNAYIEQVNKQIQTELQKYITILSICAVLSVILFVQPITQIKFLFIFLLVVMVYFGCCYFKNNSIKKTFADFFVQNSYFTQEDVNMLINTLNFNKSNLNSNLINEITISSVNVKVLLPVEKEYINNYLQQINELEQHLAEKSENKNSVERKLDDLKKKHIDMVNKIYNIEARGRSLPEEKSKLDKTSLEFESKGGYATLNRLEKEKESEVSNCQGKINKEVTELHKLEQNTKGLEAENSTLKTNIENHQANQKEINERYYNKSKELYDRMEEMEWKVITYKEEFRKKELEFIKKIKEIEEKLQNENIYESEKVNLENQLKSLVKDQEEHDHKKISDLERSEKEEQERKAKTTYETFERDKEYNKEKEIRVYKEKEENDKNKLREKEEDIKMLKNQIELLKGKLKALNDEMQTIEKNWDIKITPIKNLKLKIDDSKRRIQSTERDVKTLPQKREDKKMLAENIEKTQEELNALEEILKEKHNEKTQASSEVDDVLKYYKY